MKRKKERIKEKSVKINEIGITTDRLTSQGGLSLFHLRKPPSLKVVMS